ncbi:MAG: hypothetical protein ABIH41_07400 [Nanoarchaeota archaeon]
MRHLPRAMNLLTTSIILSLLLVTACTKGAQVSDVATVTGRLESPTTNVKGGYCGPYSLPRVCGKDDCITLFVDRQACEEIYGPIGGLNVRVEGTWTTVDWSENPDCEMTQVGCRTWKGLTPISVEVIEPPVD